MITVNKAVGIFINALKETIVNGLLPQESHSKERVLADSHFHEQKIKGIYCNTLHVGKQMR